MIERQTRKMILHIFKMINTSRVRLIKPRAPTAIKISEVIIVDIGLSATAFPMEKKILFMKPILKLYFGKIIFYNHQNVYYFYKWVIMGRIISYEVIRRPEYNCWIIIIVVRASLLALKFWLILYPF